MIKYVEKGEKTLKIKVEYNLGDYRRPRGYYVSVFPIEIQDFVDSNGNHYQMEKFYAYSGVTKLLKEVKRKSKKAEAEALEIFKDYEEILIEKVLNK